jgi:predicted phosphodiesterase
MRIAVISDVQGNLAALEAVLAAVDATSPEIDRIISAGDAVGRGPHPNEVLELFRERQIEPVLGNYDDAVAHERLSSGSDFADLAGEEIDAAALSWTRRTLTPENLEYLRQVPRDIRLSRAPGGVKVDRNTGDQATNEYRKGWLTRALFGGLARAPRLPGRRILVVHGSPRALNEFVREDTANSILSTIADNAQADVVITGHAGQGFQREAQGTTFIGVGSVSGTAARYAVITFAEKVESEFPEVQYDRAAHVRAVFESGLPSELAAAGS